MSEIPNSREHTEARRMPLYFSKCRELNEVANSLRKSGERDNFLIAFLGESLVRGYPVIVNPKGQLLTALHCFDAIERTCHTEISQNPNFTITEGHMIDAIKETTGVASGAVKPSQRLQDWVEEIMER